MELEPGADPAQYFEDELTAVINHVAQESDITYELMIGIMQMKIIQLTLDAAGEDDEEN